MRGVVLRPYCRVAWRAPKYARALAPAQEALSGRHLKHHLGLMGAHVALSLQVGLCASPKPNLGHQGVG